MFSIIKNFRAAGCGGNCYSSAKLAIQLLRMEKFVMTFHFFKMLRAVFFLMVD